MYTTTTSIIFIFSIIIQYNIVLPQATAGHKIAQGCKSRQIIMGFTYIGIPKKCYRFAFWNGAYFTSVAAVVNIKIALSMSKNAYKEAINRYILYTRRMDIPVQSSAFIRMNDTLIVDKVHKSKTKSVTDIRRLCCSRFFSETWQERIV
ncbi:hypothetical protein EDC94DRAFT_593889 [Helicostylum pulchrum]|nr:hypothetical protein EDC94DRAFT_593889 [Helicostylum pulchrum]